MNISRIIRYYFRGYDIISGNPQNINRLDCTRAEEFIEAHRLTDADQDLLKKHLSGCSECSEQFAFEQSLRSAVVPEELPAPSFAFEAELIAEIGLNKDAETDPFARWGWIGTFAAAALMGLYFIIRTSGNIESELLGSFDSATAASGKAIGLLAQYAGWVFMHSDYSPLMFLALAVVLSVTLMGGGVIWFSKEALKPARW